MFSKTTVREKVGKMPKSDFFNELLGQRVPPVLPFKSFPPKRLLKVRETLNHDAPPRREGCRALNLSSAVASRKGRKGRKEYDLGSRDHFTCGVKAGSRCVAEERLFPVASFAAFA
jgi:hypothetical protein